MSNGSILTDELKKMIGKSTEPTIYKIEEGAIFRYAEAIGDPSPIFNDVQYAGNSRYGRVICPPGFTGLPLKGRVWITEIFDNLIRAGAPPKILDGGIEFDFFIPIGAGDILASTSKITEIVEKDSKVGKMLITTVDTTYLNQNGDVVLKSRQTIINR